MSNQTVTLDINKSIQKHIAMLKPTFPRRAVISIGNYAAQILLKSAVGKNEDLLTFIQKTKEEKLKIPRSSNTSTEIVSIDEKADTHYWFNVQQYAAKHDVIVEKLKSKPIDKLDGAIMVASTGEGLGSALLPELAERFKEGNVNSVAFAILPSGLQPADAYFNAFWSMATCASKGLTQILIDRDALENYVGVNRKGAVLKGNPALDYILELALTKDVFVEEFYELSKSFNLKMFTVLAATGASLKIYSSLKNIMDTALLRSLAKFDLSTATMLYVLIRMPSHLKEKLPQSQIELVVDEWFQDKTNLKSICVSEPIYVDDGSDRLDIVMFVGGFDLTSMVSAADKKVKEIKAYASKNGFIKEREWQELMKSLTD